MTVVWVGITRSIRTWLVLAKKGTWLSLAQIPERLMATEITQLEDSTVHVKVTMYGIEANGWVSSYHLVGTKERQLQEWIVEQCKNAYRKNEPLDL